MENKVLDQAEIGNAIIVEMANIPSERKKLIAALAKNGVVMDINTPNDKLYAAIFSGIAYSKAFRSDIKKAAYSFLKDSIGEASMDSSFSYQTGLTSAGLFAGQAYQASQTNKPKTTTTTTKKNFWTDTKFGQVLGGIVTPESAAALFSTGINALNQKLTSRADKATIDQALEYEVKKAENYEKEKEQEEEQRKKWIVPVIIASSIVVLAIIGYVIYKNKKK